MKVNTLTVLTPNDVQVFVVCTSFLPGLGSVIYNRLNLKCRILHVSYCHGSVALDFIRGDFLNVVRRSCARFKPTKKKTGEYGRT